MGWKCRRLILPSLILIYMLCHRSALSEARILAVLTAGARLFETGACIVKLAVFVQSLRSRLFGFSATDRRESGESAGVRPGW